MPERCSVISKFVGGLTDADHNKFEWIHRGDSDQREQLTFVALSGEC